MKLHPAPLAEQRAAAAAPARPLRLRRGQQLLLQICSGRLWLTQDGCPEDRVLAPGERLRLPGPGHFRLGALGPEEAVWLQSLGMRMRLTISEPESRNSSASGWKKKPPISSLPHQS